MIDFKETRMCVLFGPDVTLKLAQGCAGLDSFVFLIYKFSSASMPLHEDQSTINS